MNWNALAAIAELLAAVGVIISLVYLAAQIRHGSLQVAEQSRSQRQTSLADVAQRFTEFRRSIAGDRVLASIGVRGRQNLRGLDEEERIQFDCLAAEMFWAFAMMFLYRQQGTFDEGVLDLSVANIPLHATGPGIEEWWRTSGHRAEYPDDFALVVDELLFASIESAGDQPAEARAVGGPGGESS